MNVRQNPWFWMVAAFCAALALAVGAVAVFGANSQGFRAALQATARLNLLLFWPAYVGGALTALFGNVFAPLRNNSRNFGLAFAAALNVHLGLVACLCATGNVPDARTFIVFGAAAAFVYALALLSIPRVRSALPDRVWPLISGAGDELHRSCIHEGFSETRDWQFPGYSPAWDWRFPGYHHVCPVCRPRDRWPNVEVGRLDTEAETSGKEIEYRPARLNLNLEIGLSQFAA